MRYNSKNQSNLVEIFESQGYKVRYEKGNFQSGYCIVEHSKILVVNKFIDTEAKINVMIDVLSKIEVDEEKMEEKTRNFWLKIKEKWKSPS